MELAISPDYNIIEILFQDKTSLHLPILNRCSKSSLSLSVGKSGSYQTAQTLATCPQLVWCLRNIFTTP